MAFKLPLLLLPLIPLAACAQPAAYVDPSSTDADFTIQGEYIGSRGEYRAGVQIIALGDGKFEAVGYQGGLPGDGWDGDRETVSRTQAAREEGVTTVVFSRDGLVGEVDGVKMFISREGEQVMEFERVYRESPTLGAKPPEGAVVLFDGETNRFPGAKVSEDGLLTQGATSEDKFRDFTVHIEFRLPYMPAARGQARGNSGIYLQGRYEIQMLDSFGLEGKDNECGGIYGVSAPKLNMAFPPLTWQTYDIDFTAARFDADGNKTANAKVTVKHNGVVIHQDLEIPKTTGSSPVKDETDTPGPIYLQNHGNPVRYRNIWVLPK
jgi:hypothetical protein